MFDKTKKAGLKSAVRSSGPRGGNSPRGFALVVTLVLMVLLLIIAVGLLSISSVSLRTTAAAKDHEIAKDNARLAMMLALQKLQELAGPDTRVTAPADALSASGGPSQLTGVWRSWEGKDHDTSTGLPFAPNYGSKEDTNGGDSSDDGRFLGWLVSGAEDNGATSVPDTEEGAGGTTVVLLGEGTLGSDPDKEVHLVPTEIGDNGALAWWVQGENQKALMRTASDDPTDANGWSEKLISSNRADTEDLGFTDSTELVKVASRMSMGLAENSEYPSAEAPDTNVAGARFHDITSYSRGLLTNTATGGWRRDLSLMAENYDSIDGAELKFFTLEPGVEKTSFRNSGAVGGLIYPWAEESSFDVENGSLAGGASVGWGALADFALKYKNIASGSSSTGSVTVNSKTGNLRDELPTRPILARIHWVFAFNSTKSGETYEARLNAYPVLTYWNPYNVAVTGFSQNGSVGGNPFSFYLRLGTHLPYSFKFKVGDTEQDDFYRVYHQIGDKTNLTLVMPPDDEVWQPGETRVYSPASFRGAQDQFIMARGYVAPSSVSQQLQKSGKSGDAMSGSADDSFTVEVQGSSSDLKLETKQWNGDLMGGISHTYLVPTDDASLFWPPETVRNTTQKLGTLSAGDPSPFLVAIFQLRNIYVNSTGSRGYSQTKALSGLMSANITGKPTTEGHLDALPFDWVFRYPNGNLGVGTDSGLPVDNIQPEDPYGLVGTSYRLEDGLKSLVVAEIPTRPLRSLGELQHFDVGFYSPMAPFIAEPIGNSNASFLIEPEEVYVDDSYSESERVGYDHSYVANHLFFDDWFVSSIAPETDGYSSNEIRDTKSVYLDFISGEESLPNTAYLPASVLPETEAGTAADDFDTGEEAWRDIASEIEVQGMFNVNSTSVEAWTAMLKHSRNNQVPYISTNRSSSSSQVLLSSGSGGDYPVARTSVAGDPAAASSPYNEVGREAFLTDSQIEELAVQIVEQVKARGPFLSLSEFVNRQLGSDTDLSLAGAVESALVELSEQSGGAKNPYTEFQTNFPDVVVPPGVDHPFPEAAEGNSAYGYPGWVRQADVLRPLAPVLSVRDDTFVIRAYGEARDDAGNVSAKAWCEAVVQRKADYVDPADDASVLPGDGTLSSQVNQLFGRKFELISFRWLAPDEV